jgi:ribosomal protein S18 acetylase RimI-like enzyme
MASDRPLPAHWSGDGVLLDGGTVHLRPAGPADRAAVEDFHARLSDESVYYRFFSALRVLPRNLLDRFVRADPATHLALVAELGDEIVGMASFDRAPDAEAADVAFAVDDLHHGRGLGTLLLEQLASVARDCGIRHFTADSLSTNRRVIRLFLDSGFEVERQADGAVVHVRFPLAWTPRLEGAVRDRAREAEARSIERLLGAAHVARADGDALPAGDAPFDLAVVATPPKDCDGFLAAVAARGAAGILWQADAAAPDAATGIGTAAPLGARARRHGLRIVGPRSLGLAVPRASLQLAPGPPLPPGALAVACGEPESARAALRALRARHVGVSGFVCLGDGADVSAASLLACWEDDPHTRAVALVLDSFGNARAFARSVRRVARARPVVAWLAGPRFEGETPVGSRLALAHALLAQTGVERADTVADLFDRAILHLGSAAANAPAAAPPAPAPIPFAATAREPRDLVARARRTPAGPLPAADAGLLLELCGIRLEPKVERDLIASIRLELWDDPCAGPWLALGPHAGDGPRALRALPLDLAAAREMTSCLPDLPGPERAELASVIARVARLAEEVPELTAIRLAPLLVTSAGCTAPAATVEVGPLRHGEPVWSRLVS